jgi:hypothetical protein
MSDADYNMMPPLPPLSMQAGGPMGYPGQMSDTIASMRWESDPLIHQIYSMLGGYEITVNEKNQVVRRRDGSVKPLMNDVGIERCIALVRGAVNPSVVLSNVDEDRADELTRQVLYRLIVDIAVNQDRWEIHPGDKNTVFSILEMILFMQIQRAVGGHESTNFRTQTFEQNVAQSMNQQQPQGFSLWPTFGGKKR